MDCILNKKGHKKACICIPCLGLGGTELQTINLIKILNSLDIKVLIICYFEYDPEIVKEFYEVGADVRLISLERKDSILKIIKKIRNEIRSIKPDWVHVQYMSPGALPILAARLAYVKKVYATVHQPYTKSHGWPAKIILKTASLFTTRFISVSQNAELSWFGSSYILNESILFRNQPAHFTIHNAIDVNLIYKIISGYNKSALKCDLKIPEDALIIGTVSRLQYEKGVDILLDAFHILRNEFQNGYLLIVGDGKDREDLMMKAEGLCLGDTVTFTGKTAWEKAVQMIGIMDIVVVPSRYEGFGLTAAEAMAARKPVLASDSFGLKEVVINEVTGLFFVTGDSVDLKNQLFRLCNDKALRNFFGENGRKRCESAFGMDLYRKKVSALYK